MKFNNLKKYTLFTFVCFLSLIGIAKASVLYLGQSAPINGKTCFITNGPANSSSIRVDQTDTGSMVYFENENSQNDQDITLSCTDDNGNTETVYFTLNNTRVDAGNTAGSKITAFDGEGTCTFPADVWTDSGTYQAGVGQRRYHATAAGTSITFGNNCTPRNDVEGFEGTLTFAGWLSGVDQGFTSVQTGANACAGAQMSVTTSSGNWGACYKSSQYLVQIVNSVPGATLNAGNNWKVSSSDTNDLYHKGNSATETVTLPNLTFGFGQQAVEYVWRKVGTETEVAAGTAVPHDGSVWIAKTKGDPVEEEKEFYKAVYVNEWAHLIVEGYESCTANDAHIEVKRETGECQVLGKSVTGPNEYADVIVTANGRTLTYKFSVESKLGNSQNGDEDFVIDTSSAIIIGKNDESTEKDAFLTDTCDGFNISLNGESSEFAYDINGNGMTSAVYKVTSACGASDTNTYVALCLDPGRRGPGRSENKKYKRVSDIKTTDDFGKIVLYIARNVDATKFSNANSVERIASHLAFRVVAINTGRSAALDSSDLKYAAHYRAYEAIAKSLKAGDDVTTAMSKMSFTSFGESSRTVTFGGQSFSASIKSLATKILSEYSSANFENDNKLTREITDIDTDLSNSPGYSVTYTGTLSIPTNDDSSISFTAPTSYSYTPTAQELSVDPDKKSYNSGITRMSVDEWERDDELSGGGKIVYKYKVTIETNDAINVKPPTTKEAQKAVSFNLKYNGDNTVDSIFLTEPAESFTYQRMLLFNVSSNTANVYIYFSIVPETAACDVLPALKQNQCTGESSCPESLFNKELFKATGCCKFVTDETSYLFNNVCSGNCTVSSLATVCSFDPDNDTTEIYRISEGKKHDASKPEGTDAIGECVANVIEDFNPLNVEKFEYEDDNGNSLSDDHYSNNKYCRVNCKEDWEIQMDSFGSFVGENAVAAGTYFTDGSSVFMSATRTCYTNYIDYDKYNREEVDLSEQVIEQYNIYSLNSHIYTDMKRQQGVDLDPGETSITKRTNRTESSGVCIQYKTCEQAYGSDYSWDSSEQDCSKTITQTNNVVSITFSQVQGKVNDGKSFILLLTNGTPNSRISDALEDNDMVAFNLNVRNLTNSQLDFLWDEFREDRSGSVIFVYRGSEDGVYRSLSVIEDEIEYRSGMSAYSLTSNADEATEEVEDHQPPVCAYYGKGYSYTLRTDGRVEELVDGKDVLYTADKKTWETDEDKGNNRYLSEIETKNPRNVKNNYSSTAKIECTVEEADLSSDGSTGSYKCEMTVNDYKGVATTPVDVIPTCARYVQETAKDKNNATINLDDKFKNNSKVIVCENSNPSSTTLNNAMNKYEATGNGLEANGSKSAFRLMSDAIKEVAEDNLDAARLEMSSKTNEIYANDRAMFNCQHFQLYNNSDPGMSCQVKVKVEYGTGGASDQTSLGENREYILIDSDFDPTVSYKYDEDGFMTILDDDNILVKYTEKNDKIFEKADANDSNTTTTVGGINGKINSTDASDPLKPTYEESCGVKISYKEQPEDPTADPNEFNIPHDYLETTYYNPNRKWQNNTDPQKKYEDSTESPNANEVTKTITLCTVYGKDTGNRRSYWVGGKEGGGYTAFTSGIIKSPDWNGGHCYSVKIRFFQNHYIKQSISNGSFYKTKGSWYLRASDIKEHGDDVSQALANAKERSVTLDYDQNQAEYDYWSLLGTGYNVFPVSMTTPRNLYQYTYYFGDMGSYSDGSLGRIMGRENSIITMNKRTCFYEVYEDICLCCGDKINTHYEDEDYKLTNEFLNNNQGNFPYQQSIKDKLLTNSNGTISFATSSVALGDLDSDSTRKLGTNWSANAPFYLDGSNLITNKGEKLKGIIESQGESVYELKESATSNGNTSVEYHFVLTPETMKKVREYNDRQGYEINYRNLTIYGRYSIGSLDGGTAESSFKSSDINEMNNKVSTFNHLGSKFLETVLPGYDPDAVKTESLSNRKTSNNVCQIIDTEITSSEEGARKIKNLMNNGTCRWIDYIETNGNNKNKDGVHVNARLAFK